MTFCVSNQQLGDFTDSRNSSLTVLTNSRAVENHDRLRLWQHRLLGASPPPAPPALRASARACGAPTRHPPGLRPRPTAFTHEWAPKGGYRRPPTGQGATAPSVRRFAPPWSTPPEGASPLPTASRRFPSPVTAIQKRKATFGPSASPLGLRGEQASRPSRALWKQGQRHDRQASLCIEGRTCVQVRVGWFSAKLRDLAKAFLIHECMAACLHAGMFLLVSCMQHPRS